jgi:hypothetical protein
MTMGLRKTGAGAMVAGAMEEMEAGAMEAGATRVALLPSG